MIIHRGCMHVQVSRVSFVPWKQILHLLVMSEVHQKPNCEDSSLSLASEIPLKHLSGTCMHTQSLLLEAADHHTHPHTPITVCGALKCFLILTWFQNRALQAEV